jgi:hypothetical protein
MVPEGTKLESRVRRLHSLAEQVRAVAAAMQDLEYQRTMLLTAESYKRMAKQLLMRPLPVLPEERLGLRQEPSLSQSSSVTLIPTKAKPSPPGDIRGGWIATPNPVGERDLVFFSGDMVSAMTWLGLRLSDRSAEDFPADARWEQKGQAFRRRQQAPNFYRRCALWWHHSLPLRSSRFSSRSREARTLLEGTPQNQQSGPDRTVGQRSRPHPE